MKKALTVLLILLTLTLTACGGASNPTRAGAPSQTDPAAQSLSGPTLLLLGTLKLDGTDQAVTAEQAADLLVLWQVYQEISTSDTAAPAERDALLKQIEETMTPEQMKAIQAMNLTPQDTFTVMQELGISAGRRQSSSNGNGNNGNNNFFPEGAPPGGGAPPDGGGGRFPNQGGGQGGNFPGGGNGFTPEQMATAQAQRAQSPGGNGGNFLPSALFDALIQYLQKVAGS